VLVLPSSFFFVLVLAVSLRRDKLACVRVRGRGVAKKMVHVVQGRVVQRRSIFRLSIFADLFWGIVNTIGTFFETMFSMEKANAYKQTGRTKKRGNNNFGGSTSGGGGPSGGDGGGGGRGLNNRRPGQGGPRVAGIKDFQSAGNIPGGS
jgi:uncharacterized membrane protein YgcG